MKTLELAARLWEYQNFYRIVTKYTTSDYALLLDLTMYWTY